MSKIETDVHALDLIIDNLKNFSSKADRLLVGKSISYSDFFDQYREYVGYLKTLNFETNEIIDLLQKAPKISTSEFSLMKLLLILPFFIYLYFIQIYLILLIWLPILIGVALYFFIKEKRKYKMEEIIIFNSRLINLLQAKISQN